MKVPFYGMEEIKLDIQILCSRRGQFRGPAIDRSMILILADVDVQRNRQAKEEGEVGATKMIIVGAISIRRDGRAYNDRWWSGEGYLTYINNTISVLLTA